MAKKMNLHWADSADNYSRIIDDEFASFRPEKWKELILSQGPPSEQPWRVLDCGCGPGFFTIILSSAGCDVTGIDGCVEMLDKAREKSARYGIETDLRVMDCQETEFESDTFDLIVSRNVTHALNFHRDTYREWLRILKPGGVLLIFDANWHLPRLPGPLQDESRRRMAECLRVYGSTFSDDSRRDDSTRPVEPEKEHILGDRIRPDWDLGLLEGVGFSDITYDRDITEELWDDKEKLLYGNTPMFMIRAVKG